MPASWAAAAGAVSGVTVGSAGAPDAEGGGGAGRLGLPAREGGGVGGVGGPSCGPGGATWEGIVSLCLFGSEDGREVVVEVVAL